jgi:hypothetical protein
MEPVPETRAALQDLSAYGDVDLVECLQQTGKQVSRIVPECVGLSVSQLEDGLTFTLVASSAEIAALDATQYLDGGPCVDSSLNAKKVAVENLEQQDVRG